MRTDGYKALLSFYNQVYHAMTMAASLRSIGSLFKIDARLAKNMHENVEKIIRDLDGLQEKPQLLTAWRETETRFGAFIARDINSNHEPIIYELGVLTYLSWSELCNNKEAQQCAEEYYTDVKHPDFHPGLGLIKATWSSNGQDRNSAISATALNLATIFKRIEEGKSGNQ